MRGLSSHLKSIIEDKVMLKGNKVLKKKERGLTHLGLLLHRICIFFPFLLSF